MNDFKDLNAPQNSESGWYIATKHGQVAWLTVGGEITRDTSAAGLLLIFHKTARAAHKAIWEYYRKHGLAYTYTCTEDLQDVNESQVMRFE